MSGSDLHPDFLTTSIAVGDMPLCHVRMQADARWPWLILIPRVAGVSEIEQLSPEDRLRLMEEQVRAGQAVRDVGQALLRPIAKLNIAALGNVTPQLHVHVIGRWREDAAWPAPVWGVGSAQPYSESAQMLALAAASQALGL